MRRLTLLFFLIIGLSIPMSAVATPVGLDFQEDDSLVFINQGYGLTQVIPSGSDNWNLLGFLDINLAEFILQAGIGSFLVDSFVSFNYDSIALKEIPISMSISGNTGTMNTTDYGTYNFDFLGNVSSFSKLTNFTETKLAPVPEPATWMLLGVGILALIGTNRKKIFNK